MIYRKIRSAFGRGQCLEGSDICEFLESTDPAAWFEAIPDEQKHGTWRNTSVQSLTRGSAGGTTVFCKHYPIKRGSQRLLARFGLYRSASIFALHRRLCEMAFPTPRPIAHFVCRDGHKKGSFLFSENLEGFTDLRHCADDASRAVYFRKHRLVERSLDLMALLHSEGVVHRDFKFGNLLWSSEQDRLFLIDFDGARTFDPAGALKPRARDIARFTLACHQAGLGEWSLPIMVRLYQDRARLPQQDLLPASEDLYNRLLARHNRKRPGRR